MKKLLILVLFTTCSFCQIPDYVLKVAIESAWIANASAIYKYKPDACNKFRGERYMESVLNVIGVALSKVAIGASVKPQGAKVVTQAEHNYMFLCQLAKIYMKEHTADLNTLLQNTYDEMKDLYSDERLLKAQHDIAAYAKTFNIFEFLKHIVDIKDSKNGIMNIGNMENGCMRNFGCAKTSFELTNNDTSEQSKGEIIKTAINFIISPCTYQTNDVKYDYIITSFVDIGFPRSKKDLQKTA